METYAGRFKKFMKLCNPLLLLKSNTGILKMQRLIKEQRERESEQFKKTGKKHIMMTADEIKKLRHADAVVRTSIHPDTGEIIPSMMRMSSWVPANMLINYGLIIAKPTAFNTIFWQWVNQTYNAMFNYGNRNASSVYTTKDIAQGYACAVAASISVALGLRKYFSSFAGVLGGGAKLIVFNSATTFLAVSTAGFINAYLMR